MSIHTYLCMYVYTYIYIYVYVCIYIYVQHFRLYTSTCENNLYLQAGSVLEIRIKASLFKDR